MRKPTTATKSYTALSSNRKNGKKMEKALGEKRLKKTTVHLKKIQGDIIDKLYYHHFYFRRFCVILIKGGSKWTIYVFLSVNIAATLLPWYMTRGFRLCAAVKRWSNLFPAAPTQLPKNTFLLLK